MSKPNNVNELAMWFGERFRVFHPASKVTGVMALAVIDGRPIIHTDMLEGELREALRDAFHNDSLATHIFLQGMIIAKYQEHVTKEDLYNWLSQTVDLYMPAEGGDT